MSSETSASDGDWGTVFAPACRLRVQSALDAETDFSASSYLAIMQQGVGLHDQLCPAEAQVQLHAAKLSVELYAIVNARLMNT